MKRFFDLLHIGFEALYALGDIKFCLKVDNRCSIGVVTVSAVIRAHCSVWSAIFLVRLVSRARSPSSKCAWVSSIAAGLMRLQQLYFSLSHSHSLLQAGHIL